MQVVFFKRYLESIVFNKILYGENDYEYFIGYLYNDHKVKPLHIMLPKTSAYLKKYGQAKCILNMNNVIKTNWKQGKTTLYRQIHLFIGDAFHVLPCTHYQTILLYIIFFSYKHISFTFH